MGCKTQTSSISLIQQGQARLQELIVKDAYGPPQALTGVCETCCLPHCAGPETTEKQGQGAVSALLTVASLAEQG